MENQFFLVSKSGFRYTSDGCHVDILQLFIHVLIFIRIVKVVLKEDVENHFKLLNISS